MSFESRERDVSSSLAEFAAGLEKACPGAVTRDASDDGTTVFTIETDDASLAISAQPSAPRTIASLSLPTLQVRISHLRGTPTAIAALIARIDRSMHRGGG